MNDLFRRSLLGEKKRLIGRLYHPLLISELETLPTKQGNFADWRHWVATTEIYNSIRLQFPIF
jgi:hypothetical protein